MTFLTFDYIILYIIHSDRVILPREVFYFGGRRYVTIQQRLCPFWTLVTGRYYTQMIYRNLLRSNIVT